MPVHRFRPSRSPAGHPQFIRRPGRLMARANSGPSGPSGGRSGRRSSRWCPRRPPGSRRLCGLPQPLQEPPSQAMKRRVWSRVTVIPWRHPGTRGTRDRPGASWLRQDSSRPCRLCHGSRNGAAQPLTARPRFFYFPSCQRAPARPKDPGLALDSPRAAPEGRLPWWRTCEDKPSSDASTKEQAPGLTRTAERPRAGPRVVREAGAGSAGGRIRCLLGRPGRASSRFRSGRRWRAWRRELAAAPTRRPGRGRWR